MWLPWAWEIPVLKEQVEQKRPKRQGFDSNVTPLVTWAEPDRQTDGGRTKAPIINLHPDVLAVLGDMLADWAESR